MAVVIRDVLKRLVAGDTLSQLTPGDVPFLPAPGDTPCRAGSPRRALSGPCGSKSVHAADCWGQIRGISSLASLSGLILY